MSEFTFVAGAPGSSWSMISHRLKLILDHDRSDETDERQFEFVRPYTFTIKNKEFGESRANSHFGSYFGPYNEFGERFDDIATNYSLEEFYAECSRPFKNDNTRKSIRCHWFAHQLDWLWDNCKGHKLLLIYKPTDQSFFRWKERGGWDIVHPVYTWYQNDEFMEQQVDKENQNILKFAQDKNLVWEDYSEDWWEQKFGKKELHLQYRPSVKEYSNHTLQVIYTEIV